MRADAGTRAIRTLTKLLTETSMKRVPPVFRVLIQVAMIVVGLISIAVRGYSQATVTNDPEFYGPFNGLFLADGDGLRKSLVKDDSVLRADLPWSLYGWVKPAEALKSPALVAGMGNPWDEFSRYLALDAELVILWMGKDNALSGPTTLVAGKWHFLAATFDGEEFRVYSDGVEAARGRLDLGSVSPSLQMAPPFSPTQEWRHFGGAVASFTLVRRALSGDDIKQLFQSPVDFSSIEFEEGSKPWPVQTRGQAGYRAPQDPATMPRSKAAFSRPAAKPVPAQEVLKANGDGSGR